MDACAGPANDKTWRNFIIGRVYRVLLQVIYLIQVYSGLSTLKADSPEPTRLAQSSSQAEQFRILMIRSVEISFSLSAEGHYQHGQLTFVHDACYDVSPSRLVELNSSLQLGSCLSLLTILQGCSRELKVPANDLWGYEKTRILFWDKITQGNDFLGGKTFRYYLWAIVLCEKSKIVNLYYSLFLLLLNYWSVWI